MELCPPDAHSFRKISEELIHRGVVIDVLNVRFESPDGQIMDRDVVRHPGAVSVVPLLDDGDVVMVQQFRAPMEALLLEIPAGKRDVPGEPPVETAQRELAEEVGFTATELIPLVSLCHSPGFCDEVNHIFLARGLVEAERALEGPEEEHMTIHRIPLASVFELIAEGLIVDAKTIVGLTLAAQRMGVVPPPAS